MKKLLPGIAVLLTVIAAAPCADAAVFGHAHFLGRCLGLGWADGFHAKCPDLGKCQPVCGCTDLSAPLLHAPAMHAPSPAVNAVPAPTLAPYYHGHGG